MSSPQPQVIRSPSSSSFSRATAAAASPSSNVPFHGNGSASVLDATYFGIGLMISAQSPVSFVQ